MISNSAHSSPPRQEDPTVYPVLQPVSASSLGGPGDFTVVQVTDSGGRSVPGALFGTTLMDAVRAEIHTAVGAAVGAAVDAAQQPLVNRICHLESDKEPLATRIRNLESEMDQLNSSLNCSSCLVERKEQRIFCGHMICTACLNKFRELYRTEGTKPRCSVCRKESNGDLSNPDTQSPVKATFV